MDIKKLIEMISNATYRDENDTADFPLLSTQTQKKALESVVYQWFGMQQSYVEIFVKLSELEAKCSAYEQIIAKSNFAPLLAKVAADGAVKLNTPESYTPEELKQAIWRGDFDK